jgi:hypothetical protein
MFVQGGRRSGYSASMDLAKPHMDIGLFTNRREEQLDFWQNIVGLAYDHMGKLGGSIQQLRHHMNGSILKVNHAREPLGPVPARHRGAAHRAAGADRAT